MIYLKKFILTDEDATYYHGWDKIAQGHTQDELYPLGIFALKLQEVNFSDITIFYGGNGSGKSTLLNLISETLNIQRSERYNRTRMFDFFVQHNSCELSELRNVPKEVITTSPTFSSKTRLQHVPLNSKFIASDDIFKHILNIREGNSAIRERKTNESDYYDEVNSASYYDYFGGGIRLDMEDRETIDKFRKFVDGRSKTKRQFVKNRAGQLERQFSNGENALMYFDKQIEENALYLLDEPENSMSPQFQLQLKTLIEDSVRHKNCQFVIATHSPFILALERAKIYNLDTEPVTMQKWHELENMKTYYDFFNLFRYNFEG